MIPSSTESRLRKWAYILLGYTILVILWGAWVRISHSGDGCGETWPLCHGRIVPDVTDGMGRKTWVEYSHRFTSGLYGIVVYVLYLYVRKLKSKASQGSAFIEKASLNSAYRWIVLVLIFMITEALLGAKLVLFGLVNTNQSMWRLVAMSLHQLNSFLLVGFTVRFLASTFEGQYLASFSKKTPTDKTSLFSKPLFLAGLLMIAVTGAWAALSTTLFPSASLLEGFTRDIDSSSHFVLKIRILHPILGVFMGGALALGLYKLSTQVNIFLGRVALVGSALIALGIVIGFLTLTLLSPVSLKLIHLAMAHTLWSTAVFFYHFYSLTLREPF